MGFVLSGGVARYKTWWKGILALAVHARLGSTLTWSPPPVPWETVLADGDFRDLEAKILQVVRPARKYATLDWVDRLEARKGGDRQEATQEARTSPGKLPKQAPPQ